MKKDPIRKFRDSFANYLFNHAGVSQVGVNSEGVYWVTHKGDWVRLCWLNICEYCPGCIRLRNSHIISIPKSKWPFNKPNVGGAERFEFTFHESELNESIHDLIYGCCAIDGFLFSSPLFEKSGEIPAYAWTIKGSKHYESRRKLLSERGRRL